MTDNLHPHLDEHNPTKDGLIVKIRWVKDKYPDTSDLGQFFPGFPGPNDWYIDRYTGLLVGNGKIQLHIPLPVNWNPYPGPRYFQPNKEFIPHNPNNWNEVEDTVVYDLIAAYGSLFDADLTNGVEDWLRFESFYRGEWWYMGMLVEVIDAETGEELYFDSIWQVESDSGNYIGSLESEIIEAALENARLKR